MRTRPHFRSALLGGAIVLVAAALFLGGMAYTESRQGPIESAAEDVNRAIDEITN